MKTHSFCHEQWKWHELDFITENDELRKLTAGYNVPDLWLALAGYDEHNKLQMNRNAQQEDAIWGSLVYKLDPADRETQQIFHFFLSRDMLITGNRDFSSWADMAKEPMLRKMETTDTAIEGLMIIAGTLITGFLKQINALAMDIQDLRWDLKKSNGQDVLDRLTALRHQLLVIRNLTIPVKEIHMAITEIFEEQNQRKQFYEQAGVQLDRCHFLIQEYTKEVSAMVSSEEIMASVTGNEVVKTLTVITLLFTPITAWGAWWGMNFIHMPELNEKYGYLFSGLFIFSNIALLYIYIQRKGWLGDLLNGKKQR
ncbi:magnesium transporter CorA family protein [Planococcus lenghuensis]|uniref:magnesium transporter CorA family protein n=1 Tax=Planococcus lenghuensis TaxID=2213202 RepID=UPI0018DB7718|nr:magnesium transporter CorA family protein [Planococcus lenghuensis]